MSFSTLSFEVAERHFESGVRQAVSLPAVVPESARPDELALDLAELWAELVSGACVIEDADCNHDTCRFFLRRRSSRQARRPLSPRIRAMVEPVLLGESQKVVAVDLGVSPSTIALTCTATLAMLAGERRAQRCPIVLLMCAHAAHGYDLPPARLRRSAGRADRHEVTLARPDRVLPRNLTPAEQTIVRLIVEGRTGLGIATVRETSTRTVANQLASVFRKLRVSGRGQLRADVVKRYAAELGTGALRHAG